jgi:hypothetical protein
VSIGKGHLMDSVEYPAGLAFSAWERAVSAANAKNKPPALGDGLKSLRKLYDAIDFAVFDLAKLGTPKDAEQRRDDIDTAIERKFKPLETQAKTVEQAADKWIAELKKTKPEPSAAISATDTASKGAETLARNLASFATAARFQIAKRIAELKSAEDDKDEDPKLSQHKLRLKAKVLEMFRIVKNHPEREVKFVVCVGNLNCLPYLGLVVGVTQKTLLKTVMKGDTGLKYFYGRCVYEESCYTFVGLAMPSGLRKRLERGLLDLTGSMWRVRVRSGTIKDNDEGGDDE